MKTRTIAAAALAFPVTGVQAAQAQTSRFDALANAPFKENRPTKETAQTLRDELLSNLFRRDPQADKFQAMLIPADAVAIQP